MSDVAMSRELKCPVVHFEIAPEQPLGHYWEQAKKLRDQSPILFNTLAQGFWVFTSHDLVREMYRNDKIYSTESITAWEPNPHFRMIPMNLDPPASTKYRRILNPWFTPRAIEASRDLQRSVCRRYIEAMVPDGECDAVADFAIRYPTEVFLRLMNLPVDDNDLLVRMVEDFFSGYSGDAPEKAGAAYAEIKEYFADRIAERRAQPADATDDILSALMQSEFPADDGPRLLHEEEIIDMGFLLVIAGLDTTRAQIGWMLYHFATHPQDRQRVIEDPGLISCAVEEVLRFYGIIYGDGRKVRTDTEVMGCPLKKGDMVYGLTSAANRDARYEDPDEFIVDRKPVPNLAFAAGVHRCLGAHLARSELQIALEEWLRAIPDYELAAEGLIERGAQLSLKSLPLRWTVER
jgi:cytochrome P450